MRDANPQEIIRHWEEFGRREGRYASAMLAREAALSSDRLPKDFDVGTYLRLNPDVAATIRWDFQGILHYIEHGRTENRSYIAPAGATAREAGAGRTAAGMADGGTSAQAVPAKATSGKGTPDIAAGADLLPKAFNLASYLACNPDIARSIVPNAARLKHYVEHGRTEQRRYIPTYYDPPFVAQLYGVSIAPGLGIEDAVLALKQALRPAPDRLVFFNEQELFALHGITIPYLGEIFDHDFYRYKYLRGAGKFYNRAECLLHFCETGQHEQADVSLEGAFDDEFFRAEYGTDESSHREHYERWLRGDAQGPVWPNARVFVRVVYGVKLPRAVETYVMARARRGVDPGQPSHPVQPSHFVWELFEGIVRHRTELDLSESAVAGFFVAVADRLAVGGRSIEAADLYSRILRHAPEHPRALSHRADLVHRGGDIPLATSLRQQIVALGLSNEWTYIHLAQSLLELGEPDMAMRAMAGGVAKFPGDVGLRVRLREMQEKYFYDIWERSADVALQSGYDRARSLVSGAAQSLVREEERPVVAARIRRVAVYANCDLAQCRFYRVTQRAEQLAAAGYEVTIYDYTKDHAKYMSDLMEIDCTIFYRVPAFPNVVDAICKTTELGIVTIYDIDDLVFESNHFPPGLETYVGLIDARQHASMACGVSLFAEAASLCDYGMASTPSLARHLERRVRTGVVHHQPNALSSAHIVSMASGRMTAPGEVVTIFYGSGTKAHKLDFERLIEPALARLFETHGRRIRVVVIGEITVSSLLQPWAEFIITSRPIANIASYWDLLCEADINISVLVPDVFNDCKSEIKWMEAAMFGIPSVVSSTQTHREVIVEGETGFLCDSTEAFHAALDRLVRSPEERRRVGAAAKRAVVEGYGLKRQAGRLSEAIDRSTARQLVPRRKLVIVNVFYPPQATGGATRVVYDNVRSLRTILGPEWQIDVICTLEGGPVPYALDWYVRDGVRVFCITAADHPSIDSLIEDPEMGRVFDRVLDRIDPDLIHFHCIQRLTTTCVTAAIRRRIPYLITMHDGWWISPNQFLTNANREVETYDFTGGASLDAFMGDNYVRARTLLRCIRGAARILTVSEPFGALCRRVGLHEIQVVENGVSRLPEAIRTESPTGRVRLGFIGGLADHKGYGLIRNVLLNETFKNLSLMLIDHAMHPSERVAETWGSVPVQIRGKFPQSSVGSLYSHIDVLLAPSIWPESYGLVTREAVASGCWVVASDRGAVGECVVEGRNGYIIDVSNEAGLLAALRVIDDNPAIHLRSPDLTAPIRSAHQQAEELAVIYGEILDATPA